MRLFLAIIALAALGCSLPAGTAALRSQWPETLPRKHSLEPLQIIPSPEHQCGAASLWMALAYLGRNARFEAIQTEVFTPEKSGAFSFDMESAALRRGVVPYRLEPSLQHLLTETGANQPVIVLLNLGLSAAPLWHFALVTGYGPDEVTITANEGTMAIPLSTFERCWERGKHWAIALSRPGRLPQTAVAERYLKSAHALERLGFLSETEANYRAAIARWPAQTQFRIALANTLHKQGRDAEAAATLEEALVNDPQSAAALNNYAQLLLRLGRQKEALSAAEKAALIPGAYQAAAKRTLAEVKENLSKTGG